MAGWLTIPVPVPVWVLVFTPLIGTTLSYMLGRFTGHYASYERGWSKGYRTWLDEADDDDERLVAHCEDPLVGAPYARDAAMRDAELTGEP